MKVHYEHVGWLQQLFLHSGRGDEDVVTVADGGTATGACNLYQKGLRITTLFTKIPESYA